MTKNNSHITMIVDRSGSMGNVRTDAEGAVNFFFDEQKKVPGDCTVLFVDFDTDEHFRVIHDGDLADTPKYILEPRGGTPLLDAVGLGIARTKEILGDLDQFPDKILFVVQTDGQENSSTEYTAQQIRAMVKEGEDNKWEFVFLGTSQDAWGQGASMGFGNIVAAAASGASHRSTHSTVNAYAVDYRMGTMDSMAATKGMTVDHSGKVLNAAGEEIDPDTGKVKGTTTIKS